MLRDLLAYLGIWTPRAPMSLRHYAIKIRCYSPDSQPEQVIDLLDQWTGNEWFYVSRIEVWLDGPPMDVVERYLEFCNNMTRVERLRAS